MENQSFFTSLLVDNTPGEVFKAVTNVRGWWSEDIDGDTANQYSEFRYRYKDVHFAKIVIVEVVPDQKIVWHVLDNFFNFTKDKKEWTDTKMIFEIARKGKKTQLTFTHDGLVPGYECFDVCSEGWSNNIRSSLRNLIVNGKGEPNPKEGGFNAGLIEKHKLQD